MLDAMTAKLIDGRKIAASTREKLASRIRALHETGRNVRLDAVLVEGDGAGSIYAENQANSCNELGIEYNLHRLETNATEDEIAGRILLLNRDEDVQAIMIHLPLPPSVNTERVQSLIEPEKDVEGVNPANIGNVVYGRRSLVPCTALAAMHMIESTGMALRGTRCVCVGASNIVGKPVAILLMQAEATVVSTNEYTPDLGELTKQADVLVSATGVPRLISAEMVKQGSVVIDVGISRIADDCGKMRTVGDVQFEAVREVAGFISPVPGGVGPVTVAMLLRNVVSACE